MPSASTEIDSTPSLRRETRTETERRRRERENKGFTRLRETIQNIVPNNSSKFERANILEEAATLLQTMWDEKQRRLKEEQNKSSPSTSTVSSPSLPSSIPSTPSPLTSSVPLPPPSILTPPSPPAIEVKEEEGQHEPIQVPDLSSIFTNPVLFNQMFLANLKANFLAQALSTVASPVVVEEGSRKRKAEDAIDSPPDEKKIWRAF